MGLWSKSIYTARNLWTILLSFMINAPDVRHNQAFTNLFSHSNWDVSTITIWFVFAVSYYKQITTFFLKDGNRGFAIIVDIF